MDYFREQGLKIWEREDGMVFPARKKSKDVLDILLNKIEKNGVELRKNAKVKEFEPIIEGTAIGQSNEGSETKGSELGDWRLTLENGQSLETEKLVITTGGFTYPKTGSDGQIFSAIEKLGDLDIEPLRPALVPIFVNDYCFSNLSGISLQKCQIKKIVEGKAQKKVQIYQDDLLFTHKNLSGPLILNYSRYLNNGDKFQIDFLPEGFKSGEHLPYKGCKKTLLTLLQEETGFPKAFAESLIAAACEKVGQEKKVTVAEMLAQKSASVAGNFVKVLEGLVRGFEFTVSGKAGLDVAMVTAGGVSMSEVSPASMESKKHPGLYFAGEVLNVDGNTGGYNIQFAFSSGYIAAQHILQLP